MVRVLHLYHTDIRCDSRILKEMIALATPTNDYQLFGIGVQRDESNNVSSQALSLEVYSIDLFSRKLILLPKILRHSLTLFELIGKAFVKAKKMRPEIIHCHDTTVLPLGILLKFFTKSKLIYDAHELESDRNGLSNTLSYLTLYAEKFAWPFIDFFITVSASINKWYQDNIGLKNSAVILNSPVITELSVENKGFGKSYLREKFNIPERAKIFIYVGILSRGRGIEKILDVFSVNHKSHIVFMGYGELSDIINKKAHGYSNIHFHEAVAHENVVQIVQSADVGICLIENVSLSDYYCLPNKLFEYCFAEIPILASNFPDISETVKKYNLGKCSELDSTSIYLALKEFETLKELPKINAENLYELSWGSQEKKLIKLYDNLMDKEK